MRRESHRLRTTTVTIDVSTEGRLQLERWSIVIAITRGGA